MSKTALNTQNAMVAAGLALAGAVTMGVLLASLSAPPHFRARVAALKQQADEASRLLRPARMDGAAGVGSVCARAGEQPEALRKDLADYASQLGLQLSGVDIVTEPDVGAHEALTPLQLRFEATGGYDGALGLLDLLSRRQPDVFVETVDLTSNVSSVTIAFSGHVYCSGLL